MELFNLILGSIYFLSATTLFILNVLLIVTLYKHKEYRTCTYLLIKNIIFAGIMQLVAFIGGSIMTIFQSNIHPMLERVLGALIQSGWFLYLVLSAALAVDRLLIFFFCKCIRLNKIVSWVFLLLSWLLSLTVLTILLLSRLEFSYSNQDFYLWGYSSQEESKIMEKVESFVDPITFGVIFLIYMVVLVYLVKVLQPKNFSSYKSVLAKEICRRYKP
ncbi:hypothetical protein L596_016250 [Steinernema carpocapsae]|uniref:G-protein coupled receptors family 1 profile domain-containing protein n=1 Tax=Steinernema carpocapsae TaxID=34508 RepID=A0A4U5NIM6_STECR|nr:hypothetical protein L596_016250 [Steinernema carpocapsae]